MSRFYSGMKLEGIDQEIKSTADVENVIQGSDLVIMAADISRIFAWSAGSMKPASDTISRLLAAASMQLRGYAILLCRIEPGASIASTSRVVKHLKIILPSSNMI